jgi:hypothetical protein
VVHVVRRSATQIGEGSQMIRAESYRIYRGWTFLGLLGVAILLNALSAYGTQSSMVHVDLTTTAINRAATEHLVGLGFGASLFSMIFGVIVVTRDFGNFSIGRHAHLSRGPSRLLGMRALASAVPMLVFGLAGAASVLIVTALTLPRTGASFDLGGHGWAILVGVVGSVALAGYLGQMVAWQTRRSLWTVTGLVAWTLLAEPLVITLVPAFGRFLPGGAAQGMLMDTSSTTEILTPAWAYVVYIGWLAGLSSLAVYRLRSTDLR